VAEWDVFDTRAGGVRRGMQEEAVHEALAEGRLTPTDFARPSRGGHYRRIRDIAELAPTDTGPPARRRLRPIADADLTSMADVVFLLLLFFMLTASYEMQKAIASPKPEQSEVGAQQALPTMDELEENHVVVDIDADNQIFVDEVPSAIDRLAETIRAARVRSGRTDLLLKVNGDALHGTVVAVIDAANAAGMEHIRKANIVDEPVESAR